MEVFCNIINVFTVTCDPLNVSLLNKSINLFKKRKEKKRKEKRKKKNNPKRIWMIVYF